MKERGSLVSIGMPVFNGEQYIGQALDSLLAQDHGNLELIISDNASTDRTAEICLEYASKDPRIRFHQQDSNRGPLANFNYVLEKARGDYFMWAAYDDLWESSFVSTLLNNLGVHENAGVAFSGLNNIDRGGQETRTYESIFKLSSANLCTRLRIYLTEEETLGKANLIYGLMRRDIAQMTGGFRPEEIDIWGVDMLQVFRLLSFGNIVFSEHILFHKRDTPPPPKLVSERSGAAASRLAVLAAAIKIWRGYLRGYGRIIMSASSLTLWEKAVLKKALWARAFEIYRREIRRHLGEPMLQRALRPFGLSRIPGKSEHDR